jgi:uncharacterized protein YdeI (YjbR/CyaY-like superfamily)
MAIKISSVEQYLSDGCGRCKLFATPQCKVHSWHKELLILRSMALESGYTEELKWGMPCYTLKGNNVFIISAFKKYCAINFFKGALLNDPKNLLTKPGENTQGGRQFRFTGIAEIKKNEKSINAFFKEAIEIENSGKKIEPKKLEEQTIPKELENRFKKDAAFKKAFQSLTPGRQRAYVIFFAAAKQSATREARIDKYKTNILIGKGIND